MSNKSNHTAAEQLWDSATDGDYGSFVANARAALATARREERARCAAWHDEQAARAKRLVIKHSKCGEFTSSTIQHAYATTHEQSAAAIRAMKDDTHG